MIKYDLQTLTEKFNKYPSYLKKGNNYLSNIFKVNISVITEAKKKSKSLNVSAVNSTFETIDIKYDLKNETIKYKTTQLFEPLNDIELAKLHKVDLNKYEITNYWTKVTPSRKFTSSLFVKKIKSFYNKDLIKNISNLIIPESKFIIPKLNNNSKNLFEISIPDLHVGKLAHKDESGEDYDSKIAINRWDNTINYFCNKINFDYIDKILFPVGNDMINIDNQFKTTTAGTPQDVDTRFNKMIISVKDMLLNSINQLNTLKPIDVVIVPGNHDLNTMYIMGLILEAYYKNNKYVNIINKSYPRTYYEYFNNAIMFTHGNNEKHSELGQIFANEQRELWGRTEYHYCQLGHYHKSKKVQTILHDEFQGFQYQIIPSLSSNDYWHTSKGYSSKRAAKAFLFDKKCGITDEYTFNIEY